MNLQNIFPRAMVMNVEQALKISKDSLGIDVEVIANNDITHYIQDENNVFMLIKDMVRNALHIALKPFQSKYKFDSDKELLQHYHYDFTSLETIAVFKTIDNLRDQFTEINQYKTINEYEILYQSNNDVKIEAKKKRIKKLQSKVSDQ